MIHRACKTIHLKKVKSTHTRNSAHKKQRASAGRAPLEVSSGPQFLMSHFGYR